MLFNSYEFIFLYLPVVLVGYFCLGRARRSELANVWLVAASLAFYGYWDARYLPLLVGSIAVNYVLSGRIIAARAAVKAATAERRAAKKALKALATSADGQAPAATAESADAERRMAAAEQAELAHGRVAKYWFLAGAAVNVALLGFFKYTDFLLENLNYLGADFSLLHIVLPLGISFFTITQLVYLVDSYEGVVQSREPVSYALFVSFFPHLLAGPILYHRDMLGQFADAGRRRVNWENMSRGLSLFILGLGKKVLIADALAPYATASFAAPGELSMLEAWTAVICYALQLFFDFSGYSDMAVGIARMMNIKIPFNFNSPYRAYGMIDFWQRWHMSLTWAITNYLYTPMVMACKKITFVKAMLATFAAMFIAGVWHGAGWTYVVFGSLHGLGLVCNHVWKKRHLPMWRPLGYVLTLLLVLVAHVFFRAASLGDALTILTAMFTGELLVPQKVADLAQHAGVVLPALTAWAAPKKYLLLAVLMVALLPSSQSLVERLRPRPIYAVALAALLLLSIVSLTRVSEFLYFQF